VSACALAIFVKTPGHSPVKTRLAATRGTAFAEAFHQHAAAAVAEAAELAAHAARARGDALQACWAVAEPAAMQASQWAGLARLEQGSGSLGERMAHVHAQLLALAPGALLVGADSPQMTPAVLLDACAWLARPGPRCVIGPARDGGFWLFGSNVAFPRSAWTSPAYGRDDTGAAFIAALSAARNAQWKHLPTLVDVDDAHDLAQLCGELDRIDGPPPRQAHLRRWLQDAVHTACASQGPNPGRPAPTPARGDTHEHE